MHILLVFLLLLLTSSASAQTTATDRVRFSAGPCIVTSQAGPPKKFILEGDCSSISTSPSTNLTLSPTGDLITDPVGDDILPELNYDINIGMLSKKYLTLHAAELWVETLVAQNTIATIGGRVLVAPTNILTVDLAAVTTTISVKYNNLFVGDRVYMEADGKVEFMAVTAGPTGAGPYSYTVTRNLDGSGANQWYAGDAILNTGTTGNGFIDLYSTAGVLSTGSGPSIVGNVRTGTTYNAYAPRWAIGNLNALYGYGVTTYGAAFGDPSATNVTVDATNGFRIRNSTTDKFVADTAGNLSIVGDLSVGTAGVIRSGATGFATGTGIFMDYNAGTPRFRVGNPAANQISWDGSTLSVAGTLTATSGTIGGFTLGANTLTSSGIYIQSNGGFYPTSRVIVTDSGGTNWAALISGSTTSDVAIMAGGTTPASAPFRVTMGGALTATNATITGAITATSGTFTGTISGSTITGSTGTFGGSVTLNSSGITVDAGLGSGDGYKLEGAGIGMFYDTSVNVIYFKAPSGFNWERTGASLAYTSLGLISNTVIPLGTTGNRWGTFNGSSIDITGNGQVDSDFLVDGVIYSTALAGSGRRYLCVENNGAITADNVAC